MDDNDKSLTYGVSHIDGVTPVVIQFNSTNRRMLVDFVTVIQFNPLQDAQVNYNDYPFAKATSSVNDITIRPWVVNASTGAVLVTST